MLLYEKRMKNEKKINVQQSSIARATHTRQYVFFLAEFECVYGKERMFPENDCCPAGILV